MTKEHGLLILLMSIVTILPRILPVFIPQYQMPKFLQEWSKCIPYAVLSALIFPGILHIDETNMNVGIIGLVVSVLLSLLKIPVHMVVIGTIVVVYIYYLIFI